MAGVVTVACKLPNGLILRLFEMAPEQELVMGGGVREVMKAHDLGTRVEINGNTPPFGQALLDSQGEPISTARGFALTTNVDADFWDEWLHQNEGSDIVKRGLIFAHARTADVRAEAREKEKVWTGLEPMRPATPTDTTGDPRMPSRRTRRGENTGISAVTAIDREN